ncbi:hypothetical protein ACTXT7_002268 [Hymenolepis weldensis]
MSRAKIVITKGTEPFDEFKKTEHCNLKVGKECQIAEKSIPKSWSNTTTNTSTSKPQLSIDLDELSHKAIWNTIVAKLESNHLSIDVD